MRTFLRRQTPARLALALAFVTGCDNQIAPTSPSRLGAGDAVSAAKAPIKSVVALEPLPGGAYTYSVAYGINDLGQAVGETGGPGFIGAAVIWDNSTVPQALGILPGGQTGTAVAISNDGRVIAGQSATLGVNTPVRWLKSNGQWLIDPLPIPPNTSACFVSGVSSDGTAISGNCSGDIPVVWINGSRISLGAGFVSGVNAHGQAVGTDASSNHAVMWTITSSAPPTIKDLGNLGGASANATAINDAGEVTGASLTADNAFHAFLWSPKKGAMVDLGPAGSVGNANAINAAGVAAGNSLIGGQQHGVVFDHGKLVDLGLLPGYTDSGALGLNNVGGIVGASSSVTGVRATKWTLK